MAVDRGPLAAGAPSHGTTGTMDNPALPALNRQEWRRSVAQYIHVDVG